MTAQNLSLYLTAEHPCGYYDDRMAANLVPDPHVPMTADLYSLLVSKGFRRSGGFVYRPHCRLCSACEPCRIDVAAFRPNRNQRRCLKANDGIVTRIRQAAYTDEYFQLYARYLNTRHQDGGMANPTEEDFRHFLLCDWANTWFIESRLDGNLVSVAVSDQVVSGFSAVYTFFDPDYARHSLGTFAVLQQIWLAQVYQRPYVYLGYWIKGHPKMDYKTRFSALEMFHGQGWEPRT